MNPERDNTRAAADRKQALLQEKTRIETELEELECREKLLTKKPINLPKLLIKTGLATLCISFVISALLYSCQPKDVFTSSGRIVKTTEHKLPDCKMHTDKSGKLYYPEKCGSPIREYGVIFSDNENKKITFSIKDDSEHCHGWNHEEIALANDDTNKTGCGSVMIPKGSSQWNPCDSVGCEVDVYYRKNAWFFTSQIKGEPVIKLRYR